MKGERINWENEPKLPDRNIPGNIEESTINGISFDVHKLINLTEGHPVAKKPIETYLSKLLASCWVDQNEQRVTPRTLINIIKEHGYDEAIEKYPHFGRHIQKIRDADYSFPLHVYQDTVINGMHRLSKLMIARETGESTQDFVTVKDLKEIPKEAQTSSGLLRKTPEERMRKDVLPPHDIEKDTVLHSIRERGPEDPRTVALLEEWIHQEEHLRTDTEPRTQIEAELNMAEIYFAMGDLQGAEESLHNAYDDAKTFDIPDLFEKAEQRLNEFKPESE
jgi:hypothetical protein